MIEQIYMLSLPIAFFLMFLLGDVSQTTETHYPTWAKISRGIAYTSMNYCALWLVSFVLICALH